MDRGMNQNEALVHAGENVLREQQKHTSIPKRFSFPMREIWEMQIKFPRRHGKNAFRLMEHKRFRAAYDFLILRCLAGEEEQALCDWWTRFQEMDMDGRDAMVQALAPQEEGTRRKRRPRKRRPASRGPA